MLLIELGDSRLSESKKKKPSNLGHNRRAASMPAFRAALKPLFAVWRKTTFALFLSNAKKVPTKFVLGFLHPSLTIIIIQFSPSEPSKEVTTASHMSLEWP
jgi:hypothetical protein